MLKISTAIVMARIANRLSRLFRKGKGSSLPGVVALKICPEILETLASQTKLGTIMVTGTNGKTTTNNMLAGILSNSGYRVVANSIGANLIGGVTAAFIEKATLGGKVDCDYACLEVDEAFFPVISKKVKPGIVIVTNFFRDQLDRYGELDKTIKFVEDALKLIHEPKLVLNADDPLVAKIQINSGLPAFFYGFGEKTGLSEKGGFRVREARFCPFCGERLDYSYYHYGQLGNFQCNKCGFQRPSGKVEACEVGASGGNFSFIVRYPGGSVPVNLSLGGIYNIYNALAAFSAGFLLEKDPLEMSMFLKNYRPATGRMEEFNCLDKKVVLNLVKNPTGFGEGLMYLLSSPGPLDVLIAINDQAADGRDISWLWDVDFEMLEQIHGRINVFICTGLRAQEMGVRLKYAGVPVEKIIIEPDYSNAVKRIMAGAAKYTYLLATYTALWPVEKELRKYVA
ncbi:MAG: MurT ligase domain-containing protein [Eubacteriales bacterium]